MNIVNPSIFANRRIDVVTVKEIDSQRSVELLRELGLEIRGDQDRRRTSGRYQGSCGFDVLLKPSFKVEELINVWNANRARDDFTVAELVLFEQRLALCSSYDVARYLDVFNYTSSLIWVRNRLGRTIYDYGRSVNWRRPVLHTHALRVARAFLRNAVSAEHGLESNDARQYLGRIARATCLIDRFESESTENLEDAIDLQIIAFDHGGGQDLKAFENLIELSCALYDKTHDFSVLRTAEDHVAEKLGPISRWSRSLISTFIQLKLRQMFSAPTIDNPELRRAEYLAARGAIETLLSKETPAKLNIDLILLKSILDQIEESLSILSVDEFSGLRVPFITRSSNSDRLLKRYGDGLLNALKPELHHLRALGEFIYADILEAIAYSTEAGALADVRDEVMAHRISASSKVDHRDTYTDFLIQQGSLDKARESGDSSAHSKSILELVRLSCEADGTGMAELLIARELEMGQLSVDLDELVEGTTQLRSTGIYNAVRNGDIAAIYEISIQKASNSPDMRKIPLGGRSQVETVADYYGIAAESFIVKDRPTLIATTEDERIGMLKRVLGDQLHSHRFQFQESLCNLPIDGEERVRSARRFHPGVPVRIAAVQQNRDTRIRLLSRVATFLALIHANESANSDGMRRQIISKELGRWLQKLGLERAGDEFSEWYEMVDTGFVYARRDAHLDNWIIKDNDVLVAIDLEAGGARPLGYELAQVTDDAMIFEANDLEARISVARAYLSALGVEYEPRLEKAYLASVGARAVRRITEPEKTDLDVSYSLALLKALEDHHEFPDLASWSRRVRECVINSTSQFSYSDSALSMSEARRVLLSKEMSWNLRHNSSLARTADGWVDINDLQSNMTRRAKAREIHWVGTHVKEKRFIVQGDLIAARYGHSREIPRPSVSDAVESSLGYIYHSTTLAVLRQLVEKNDGLQPMSREMVHMSSDSLEAISAGRRKGNPVLLRIDAKLVPSLERHSEVIYLSPTVPRRAISVQPFVQYWRLFMKDGE